MVLIRSLMEIPLENGEVMLINTLSGRIDLVSPAEWEIIRGWQRKPKIVAGTEIEYSLYRALEDRGYLVSSQAEEQEQKMVLMAELKKSHQKRLQELSTLAFIITYGCNFRCPYCYEETNKNNAAVMTEAMVEAAFFAGGSATDILLFGGEPLLPENDRILRYILAKGEKKRLTVLTNGYHLKEYTDLLKTTNLNYIQVTLDGPENLHNRRRRHQTGSPTYKRILEGIEQCLEAGMSVRIRMNVDTSNFDQCCTLKDRLQSNFRDYSRQLTFEIAPIFQIPEKDKHKVYTQLYRFNYDKNGSFEDKDTIIAPHRPIVETIAQGLSPRPVFAYCYEHGQTIFVDPFGDMYSCILSVGIEDLSIGKYYPAWSYKLNSIFTRDVNKIESCRQCRYTFICGGGCPLELSDYTNVMLPVCGKTIDDLRTLIPALYQLKTS